MRLTVEVDEGQERGDSHHDGPGKAHADAQPQLADAVAEAELVHDRLAYGVPGIVRVRLLPPLCNRAYKAMVTTFTPPSQRQWLLFICPTFSHGNMVFLMHVHIRLPRM